jgi:hypothetical protein
MMRKRQPGLSRSSWRARKKMKKVWHPGYEAKHVCCEKRGFSSKRATVVILGHHVDKTGESEALL